MNQRTAQPEPQAAESAGFLPDFCAIRSVFGAIHEGDPTNDLIAIRYLDTLARLADGKASKIFLPLEVSGILGSIGGIAELFGKEQEAPPGEVPA